MDMEKRLHGMLALLLGVVLLASCEDHTIYDCSISFENKSGKDIFVYYGVKAVLDTASSQQKDSTNYRDPFIPKYLDEVDVRSTRTLKIPVERRFEPFCWKDVFDGNSIDTLFVVVINHVLNPIHQEHYDDYKWKGTTDELNLPRDSFDIHSNMIRVVYTKEGLEFQRNQKGENR